MANPEAFSLSYMLGHIKIFSYLLYFITVLTSSSIPSESSSSSSSKATSWRAYKKILACYITTEAKCYMKQPVTPMFHLLQHRHVDDHWPLSSIEWKLTVWKVNRSNSEVRDILENHILLTYLLYCFLYFLI